MMRQSSDGGNLSLWGEEGRSGSSSPKQGLPLAVLQQFLLWSLLQLYSVFLVNKDGCEGVGQSPFSARIGFMENECIAGSYPVPKRSESPIPLLLLAGGCRPWC